MYRWLDGAVQVFLVHPGGPFWAKKQMGSWSIPKGECLPEETPMAAAIREFVEETGFPAGSSLIDLDSIRQASGKVVTAWAFEGDADPSTLKSNTCTIEWPPRSGKSMEIPEVDEGRWFPLATAREFIVPGQVPLLDRLVGVLA